MSQIWQLFLIFLKINLLTTSGPASVGLLYDQAVGKFMTESQFIEAVGLSSARLLCRRIPRCVCRVDGIHSSHYCHYAGHHDFAPLHQR